MPFGDPVVAGTELIREAVRSPNYVAGVSGWTINRDGTVEFLSAVLRGELLVSDADGSYVQIAAGPGVGGDSAAQVELQPWHMGDGIHNWNAGGLLSGVVDDAEDQPYVSLVSPINIGGQRATLTLFGEGNSGNNQFFQAVANLFEVIGRIGIRAPLTTTNAFAVLVPGDSANRLTIKGSSELQWGPGNAAADTNLYRSAANTLRTDDALSIGGTIDWGSSVTVQDVENALDTSAGTGFGLLGATCGVAFVAPPSGKMLILYAAQQSNSVAGNFSITSPEVRTGTTVGSGTVVMAASDDECVQVQGTNGDRAGASVMVTGLTAGANYNVSLWSRTNAVTASIRRRRVIATPVM